MPIVRVPDGRQVRFPDDMPREQIKALIMEKFPEKKPVEPLSADQVNQMKGQAKDLLNNLGIDANGGVAGSALKGFGKGVLGGAERVAAGATFGISDWVGDKLGTGVKERRQELEELSPAIKYANLGTELASGGLTGGGLFKGVSKGLGAIPKVGKAAQYLAPTVTGAVSGGLYSGFENDSLNSGLTGAAIGGAMGGALDLAGRGLSKAWSAASKVKNTPRGFENAVGTKEGARTLNRAVRESDKIAEQVYSKAPEALETLNRQAMDKLDDAVRGVDVKGRMAGAKKAYGDFIDTNKSNQVIGGKFTPEEYQANLRKWGGNDLILDENGNPFVVYHGTNTKFDSFDPKKIGWSTDGGFYGKGFYFARNKGEASYYGKNVMPVYLKSKNMFNIEGLDGGHLDGLSDNLFEKGADLLKKTKMLDKNQIQKVSFYKNIKKDFIKNAKIYKPSKYNENTWGAEIKTPDGETIIQSAWPSDNTKEGALNVLWRKYSQKIKYKDGTPVYELLNDFSLKDFMRNNYNAPEKFTNNLKALGYDGVYQGDEFVIFDPKNIKSVNNTGAFTNTASLTDKGVKPLAKVSDLGITGLTDNQKAWLNQAWTTGKRNTLEKAGSLGHLDEMSKELNKMVQASRLPNATGVGTVATPETVALQGLKDKVDDVIEKAGLQNIKAQYRQAKSLEDAFNRGLKYSPTDVKTRNLTFNNPDERSAFAQGLVEKIKMNPESNNIAGKTRNLRGALRKALGDKADDIFKDIDKINKSYKNVEKILGNAERKLQVPEAINGKVGLWREYIESPGSIVGGTVDLARKYATGKSAERAAQYLLNPNLKVRKPLFDILQPYLPTSAAITQSDTMKGEY